MLKTDKQCIIISDELGRSGIHIGYNKSRRTICISGWYDSFVGIDGECMSLLDFCRMLGIDKKALLKTIEEIK